MSEFLFPFLQWAGVMAAAVAGFLCLESGLGRLVDRLIADPAPDAIP